MERTIRLATASRYDLVLVIRQLQRTNATQQETIAHLQAEQAEQQRRTAELQASNAALAQRLAELERQVQQQQPQAQRFPGHQPKRSPQRAKAPLPHQRRSHGFARRRSAQPDQVVTPAVEQCPTCATPLRGGWVKRRRQVLDLPPVRVQVVEHQYLERECPQCRRRWTPPAVQPEGVVGQDRLGVHLLALVATLREVGRLPLATIAWLLATLYGLELSVGALAGVLQRVATRGEAELRRIQAAVQGSAVVHGDETGWRENGHNGYVWSFSTVGAVVYAYGRRTKEMVDQALGTEFAGVLVTDFYAAYDHYPGRHQRCWVHLLRDIHDLRLRHPADATVATWAREVRQVYDRAKELAAQGGTERQRLQHREEMERALAAVVAPWAEREDAPQRVLSQRMLKYLSEVFTFVELPGVPSDNNAAERRMRPVVTERKISGGTRSGLGTSVRITLASLFGTWRLRGLNPFEACRQLLLPPQL
jgi:transposase